MDYYSILGVNKNATQEEIKKAYKKMVMEHHPDRGGDNDHFAKINQAYETLKDPTKRAEYDNPQPQFNFRSGNVNDFHDIFSQFFGQHTIVRKNKDIRLSVTVTLEDVAVGKDILGSYTLPSGRTETSNFKIPAGVEHGEVIRFKGLGDDSYQNLDRGDLLVQVRILNHKTYQRDGTHIYMKEKINVFDLLTGTTIIIQDLTGASISVNISKGTQPDTILSVTGYGLPDRKTGKRGNLYIKVGCYLPDLNNEVLDKIKEIKNEISNSTE